jgi:phosphate starvation-inducible PhoH-like protein
MIVTGDLTQIDLPSSVRSGLSHAMHILRDVKGIGIVELNKKDIVRHKLVTRIVEAYEKEGKTHSNPPCEGGDSYIAGGNKRNNININN